MPNKIVKEENKIIDEAVLDEMDKLADEGVEKAPSKKVYKRTPQSERTVIIGSSKDKSKEKPIERYVKAMEYTLDQFDMVLIEAGFFSIQRALQAITEVESGLRRLSKRISNYKFLSVGRFVRKEINDVVRDVFVYAIGQETQATYTNLNKWLSDDGTN